MKVFNSISPKGENGDEYRPNAHCYWLIRVPEGESISIEVTEFNLELSSRYAKAFSHALYFPIFFFTFSQQFIRCQHMQKLTWTLEPAVSVPNLRCLNDSNYPWGFFLQNFRFSDRNVVIITFFSQKVLSHSAETLGTLWYFIFCLRILQPFYENCFT